MSTNSNFPPPTFVAVMDQDTSYGAVCRQGNYHIRHYPRKIKNGMSCYKAAVYCAYANLPTEYLKLFSV